MYARLRPSQAYGSVHVTPHVTLLSTLTLTHLINTPTQLLPDYSPFRLIFTLLKGPLTALPHSDMVSHEVREYFSYILREKSHTL